MIRSKILGQKKFAQTPVVPLISANVDLGHFSIGSNEPISPLFEDVLIPPKYLWIRSKVHVEICQDTPVIGSTNSFVWSGEGRCLSIKLEGVRILHAQKDYEIDKCWKISSAQIMYEHRFAVASTIYATNGSIHLWPCGGYIGNVLETEQLFAQVGSDTPEMFVNSFSVWKKHLDDIDSVIFEPPKNYGVSLLSSLTSGKFSIFIEQKDTQFCFSSCRVEPTENTDFIDILCERNT